MSLDLTCSIIPDILTVIPYISDEEADAANKNPHLKLLFRLCNFKIMDEGTAFSLLVLWSQS